jgi:signal transduction histidine kinase
VGPFDLLLQLLTQLGGGPGAVENNLVRFGLPAFFWAILLAIAWSRQRTEPLPRERLLLFGFALAFGREFFMFLHTAERLVRGTDTLEQNPYVEPLEHALALSAVLLISAAFLRYILDDEKLPRRFLLAGALAVILSLTISFMLWPAQHSSDPGIRFNDTWGATAMHLTKALFVTVAIIILVKKHGWLRNVIIVALSFLLGSVLLTLLNTATGRAYNYILCPLGNNLHIWAVPIFGFVYFREQNLAKQRAEQSLALYRGRLEQLVDQRTSELSMTNERLEMEMTDRIEAQDTAARWADGLAQLHELSLRLNATLDPAEICTLITSQAAGLLDCSTAGLFRIDEEEALAVGVASYGMVNGGVDGIRLSFNESELLRARVGRLDPIVVEDTRNHPLISASSWSNYPMRALIGVPVVGSGVQRGLLFVIDAQRPRRWLPSEIKLLNNYANRAAVAWENALLHRQLEWTAALQERQRIAAEMHDGLAQTISILALRNDRAAQMVEEGRPLHALDELKDIQGLISVAGSDLRRSIASLRETPPPACSLQEALGETIAARSSLPGPAVDFHNRVQEPIVDENGRNGQLVHIVCEAVLNATRHAQASTVLVTLDAQGTGYQIGVEDDGCGFDVAAAAKQPGDHFGLSIMQARAARIGAVLEIDSRPGTGTLIGLRWPAGDNDLVVGSAPADITHQWEQTDASHAYLAR